MQQQQDQVGGVGAWRQPTRTLRQPTRASRRSERPASDRAPAPAARATHAAARRPAQERINRNVNELSAKLLEGCKLLSESCPDTNVPLVLTKDGRMFSVGSSRYYRREGGRLVPAAEPLPPAEQAHPQTWMRDDGQPSLDMAYPPYAPPAEHYADDVSPRGLSERVASKLLDGWQLLAESCPETNVPLVHSRDGLVLSVGTGKSFVRDASGALRELPAAHGLGRSQHHRGPLPPRPTPARPGSQAACAADTFAMSAGPTPAAPNSLPRAAAGCCAAAHGGGLNGDAMAPGNAPGSAQHTYTLETTLVRRPPLGKRRPPASGARRGGSRGVSPAPCTCRYLPVATPRRTPCTTSSTRSRRSSRGRRTWRRRGSWSRQSRRRPTPSARCTRCTRAERSPRVAGAPGPAQRWAPRVDKAIAQRRQRQQAQSAAESRS